MKDLDPISSVLGTESGMEMVKFEPKEDTEGKKDFDTARANIHEILEQAMEHLPGLLDLAAQSQSEKVYMAAAQMIKTLSDTNVQLVKLSKEGKSSTEEKKNTPSTVTQNNVYIGTTEEYLRELSKKEQEQDTIVDVDHVKVDDI